MTKYLIKDSTLTGIADAIRGKTGSTDALQTDQMAAAIEAIPEATALDELTNPGSADTMLEGTEMLNAEGKKVTGAIPVRSSSDLTASGSSVSIKPGYYPMGYGQSVMIATMRKPTISVDDQGIITASVNYPTGYVTGGNLSQLKNLDTKAASTITPTTANQTAVAKGLYTTGDVVVAGDANLVADNIKSGVSIFGVAGTMTAGEDVTAETNTYTSLLDDLEAAVDSLPDAGGGSSGGGVETCTVKLIIRTGWNQYGFTVYENGVIDVVAVTAPFSASETIVVENVVCGSIFSVYPSGGSAEASIMGGATLVGNYTVKFFKATMTANETTEITIYSNL